ncbi:MAG: hypothetical protein ABI895_02250 [Deltaproteobacteria bacterium]
MPPVLDDRIETLRRKIAGLHALASDRSATSPEAASARQTAQRLQRELAQLLDEIPSSQRDEADEPQSYRAAPPSSARRPENTARMRTPRAGGSRHPPIEPASNGWLSKVFYTIPPLLALAGIQVYRAEQDHEVDRIVADPAASAPVQQRTLPSGAEYCAQVEPQLQRSFVSLPRHWSERLTLLSFAPQGCSGSFVAQLDLSARERHAQSALFDEARSLIERKLCGDSLTQPALVEHGAVFSFRLQDRVGQLLTEFQIDGGSCDALRPAGSAQQRP